MLSFVQAGTSHPPPFHDIKGHPRDPLLPTGAIWLHPEVLYYDLWCQIMVRAVIAVCAPYDLDDLMRLGSAEASNLSGNLVTFEGQLKGRVVEPAKWRTNPVCRTQLTRELDGVIWQADLSIKTHYVYSLTAAEGLSDGDENGVLAIRGFKGTAQSDGKRLVRFYAVPLIIGSGILKF